MTGASGLLGREILKRFQAGGWDALGLAYSRVKEGLRKVDLCNASEVEQVLEDFRPSVVVHSAAERRPDVVEKQVDAVQALNVSATESLTDFCQKRSIYLLYISSDYVFDGKNPPYKPDAATNPLNTYGKTKRDGELAVLKYQQAGVLRVPVLYGEIEQLGESAVTTLFSAVKNSAKEGRLCDHQQRYPTHIADVAQVCFGLAEKHLKEGGAASGIWHWSGNECMTKYAMALVMADIFKLGTGHLVAVKGPPSGTPRPYDCHFDCSATDQAIETQQTKFREGIEKVLQKFL